MNLKLEHRNSEIICALLIFLEFLSCSAVKCTLGEKCEDTNAYGV